MSYTHVQSQAQAEERKQDPFLAELKEKIKTLKPSYILVSDTDGHGVTLATAYTRALGLDNVLVASHFAMGKGAGTSGRDKLIDTINTLAEAVGEAGYRPTVYFLDVPLKTEATLEQVKAYRNLSRVANIVIVDHLHHGEYVGLPLPGTAPIDFRLKTKTIETFLEPLVAMPDETNLRLAGLGTIFDMSIGELPPHDDTYIRFAQAVKIARELGDEEFKKLVEEFSIDKIRANYEVIMALDQAVKFGKFYQTSRENGVGNMSAKILWIAENGLDKFFEEALKNLPKIDLSEKDVVVEKAVAYTEKMAPKGMIFKYAGLISAKYSDTKITIVSGEGFTPDKAIIVVAQNPFEDIKGEVVPVIAKLKDVLFNEFKARGYSTEQDFPRFGGTAFSIGVARDKVGEALKTAVEIANNEYAKYFKEELMKRVVQEEITVLVGDKALATSIAKIIAEVVEPLARDIREIKSLLKQGQ